MKSTLNEIFSNAYNIIFEADQSKMTPEQVKKDIEKRNKAQTIGIEIEMYCDLDEDALYSYLSEDLELVKGDGEPKWETDTDASLMTTYEYINPFNKKLYEDPVEAVNEFYGLGELATTVTEYLQTTDTFEYLKQIQQIEEDDAGLAEEQIEEISDDADYPEVVKLLASYGEYDSSLDGGIDKNKIVDLLVDDSTYEGWVSDYYYDHGGSFESDDTAEEGQMGVEIRFNGPRKLSELDSILEEVETIVNDDYINANYSNGSHPTGLHVHFGLSQHNPTNLDLLRLVINAYEKHDEIKRAAQREYNKFAMSLENIISKLDKSIDPENEISYIEFPSSKMDGMSYFHRKGKGTAEFRWASSSIAFDGTLDDYISMLIQIVNASFTGSDELNYNGYTIKETSKGVAFRERATYSVIKDGKLVKKLYSGDYSQDIKTHGEKRTSEYDVKNYEIEKYINEYNEQKAKYDNYMKMRKKIMKKLELAGDYDSEQLYNAMGNTSSEEIKDDLATLIKINEIERVIKPKLSNFKNNIDNYKRRIEYLKTKMKKNKK